jgi:hypothetical protein
MDQDGKAHNDRDAVLTADLRSEDSKNVCVPLEQPNIDKLRDALTQRVTEWRGHAAIRAQGRPRAASSLDWSACPLRREHAA